MQTASGAVACQLVDALHPGTVALHKVLAWRSNRACHWLKPLCCIHKQCCDWMMAFRKCKGCFLAGTGAALIGVSRHAVGHTLFMPGGSCPTLLQTLQKIRWWTACCGCLQVDFNASKEYEMIVNYKVLQAAFTKNGIDKVCQ